MARRIVALDGHPDPRPERLGHALADAYAEGATSTSHEVRRVKLATLDLPLPGGVGGADRRRLESWLERMRALGARTR